MATETMRFATFLDKGGTGKTTTAAHIGVALAEQGHRVLAIDLAGKQGDLAKQLGVWSEVKEKIDRQDAWPNVSTLFAPEWSQIVEKLPSALDDMIVETEEGIDLIPAHPGLDTLDDELAQIDQAADRYGRLDQILDQYVDGYDVIMIDLPGLSNNVSYNGLWAAGRVIAPIEMGPFERDQLGALRDDLDSIEETHGTEIELSLVLPNKVDRRTSLSSSVLEEIRDEHGEIVGPGVPKSQDIRNAADQGRTVFGLDSPSSTAREAREAFREAARMVSGQEVLA